MNIDRYRVVRNDPLDLSHFSTTVDDKTLSKEAGIELTRTSIEEISSLQSRLYADGKTALLIIFQAMDAAGKDNAIKNVMNGVNPQGVRVTSFKVPSEEERSHDFMWRAVKALPPRGYIGIFNRSYYEDVLIARVRKLYEKENIAPQWRDENTIARRYKHIRDFEQYLWENGTVIVKLFLHVSKEKQRERFLSRIENKDKNWKFTEADLKERSFWDDYQEAYSRAIAATSTPTCPWYVVPADRRWYTHTVVAQVLLGVLNEINPVYPTITSAQEQMLDECKRKLLLDDTI